MLGHCVSLCYSSDFYIVLIVLLKMIYLSVLEPSTPPLNLDLVKVTSFSATMKWEVCEFCQLTEPRITFFVFIEARIHRDYIASVRPLALDL